MLSSNTLKSNAGSRKKNMRVGRGNGSGKGTYCTRGCNGQNSRSGGGVPDWFEGGQTPLFRRLPKLKGFSNARFKKHYNVINLSDLEQLAEAGVSDISTAVLLEKGVLARKTLPLKVLGDGTVTKKVIVKTNKISKTAQEAIEKAGGSVEIIA